MKIKTLILAVILTVVMPVFAGNDNWIEKEVIQDPIRWVEPFTFEYNTALRGNRGEIIKQIRELNSYAPTVQVIRVVFIFEVDNGQYLVVVRLLVNGIPPF